MCLVCKILYILSRKSVPSRLPRREDRGCFVALLPGYIWGTAHIWSMHSPSKTRKDSFEESASTRNTQRPGTQAGRLTNQGKQQLCRMWEVTLSLSWWTWLPDLAHGAWTRINLTQASCSHKEASVLKSVECWAIPTRRLRFLFLVTPKCFHWSPYNVCLK